MCAISSKLSCHPNCRPQFPLSPINAGILRLQDRLNTSRSFTKSPCLQSRYIGSLVGDFHRTLLYGGIYGYPGDSKNKTGKLRLLYECAPMSFIAEQAGGRGSDGQGRVLDIDPTAVRFAARV